MKKCWIVRMDEKAVSPVIATILMVAITVVLAAVLYVMVTGLIGGGGGGAPPATSMTQVSDPTPPNTYEAQVQTVNRGFSSWRVSLRNVTAGTLCGVETALADALSIACGGTPAVTLTFQDLASDSANQLNGGDRFRISNVQSGFQYTINLVWAQTGAIATSITLPAT